MHVTKIRLLINCCINQVDMVTETSKTALASLIAIPLVTVYKFLILLHGSSKVERKCFLIVK